MNTAAARSSTGQRIYRAVCRLACSRVIRYSIVSSRTVFYSTEARNSSRVRIVSFSSSVHSGLTSGSGRPGRLAMASEMTTTRKSRSRKPSTAYFTHTPEAPAKSGSHLQSLFLSKPHFGCKCQRHALAAIIALKKCFISFVAVLGHGYITILYIEFHVQNTPICNI